MNAVVILSHPDLENSVSNKTIITELKNEVDNLEVRHIEALYPDFRIDVEAEQKALLEADIVILQHPFYWYSTPAGLKQWLDDVLVLGFAFGRDGDKLKGKHCIQSVTVGGPQETYSPLGHNHFTVEEFLRPMQQTVYLTQMVYHGFIHTHRNHYLEGVYNSRREVTATAKEHAARLMGFIEDLRKGDIPKIEAFVAKWFQAFDEMDEYSFFTQYMAPDITMDLADADPIRGIEGFKSWYAEVKQLFKAPIQHIVKNVEILPVNEPNHYTATFDIMLKAVSKADGSLYTVDAIEQWLLEWNTVSNRPKIKAYNSFLKEEEAKAA